MYEEQLVTLALVVLVWAVGVIVIALPLFLATLYQLQKYMIEHGHVVKTTWKGVIDK